MKNVLTYIKRNVISRLQKFRDNHLEDITNIPKPIPTCYKCDEPHHIYRAYEAGIGLCYDCYESLEHCSYCNRGQLSLKNGICSQCMHQSANVMGYSEKPDVLFHRIKRGKQETPPLLTYDSYGHIEHKRHYYEHFGVEIETDTNGESPRIEDTDLASLVHLLGKGSTGKESLLYCKNDCTCFVEVVSQPMSWNYWLLYGQEVFYTLFQKLRENRLYGYSANDSGMHIHVSRKAIKPFNLKKIIEFVYNPSNYDFILDISQRTDEKLQEWGNPDMDDCLPMNEYLVKCINSHTVAQEYMERSTAINLHNRNSVEFRIFRGTLNFQSFSKNLEFVRSLLQWAKVTSMKIAESSEGLKSYLSFLEKNQNEYQNLCFFLMRRNYGVFKTVTQRMNREYSQEMDNFSFNSDTKELAICV